MLPGVLVAATCLLSQDGPALTKEALTKRPTGISARFLGSLAVEGQPLVVRIRVAAPASAIGRVDVEARPMASAIRHQMTAVRDTRDPTLWLAHFPPNIVFAAGDQIELRAKVIGVHEGTMLALGHDMPVLETVLTAAAASYLAPARRASPQAEGAAVVPFAHVGVEGRLGTRARARVAILVEARLSALDAALIGVSVGPSFLPPPDMPTGGPMVLGFRLSWRRYTVDCATATWAPYIEAGAAADARLPGIDPSVGVRVGLSYALGNATRLELALEGAGVLMSVDDGGTRKFGTSGGLGVGFRFGETTSQP